MIFRSAYLNGVSPDLLPHDAAATLYDTLVRFLRIGLRSVVVLGLVIALGAFLTGPSVTAVRARGTSARALAQVRGSAESAGLRTGPVGNWVWEHRQVLRIGAVAVAGLALVFWVSPPAGHHPARRAAGRARADRAHRTAARANHRYPA